MPGGPQPENRSAQRSRFARCQYEEDANVALEHSNGHANGDYGDTKDGAPIDWQGDGPRQRVGYDDLTAIDWIFEYTKERQRLRLLRARARGWLGQLEQLWDASQIWLVLVATGVASGILASCINIASNWLEDLKGGYCRQGPGGGRFYLNREFCCWGLDGTFWSLAAAHSLMDQELAQCSDWTPWGDAFGISVKGGKYVVEYGFFVFLSVNSTVSGYKHNLTCKGRFRSLCRYTCARLCTIREAERHP